MKVFAAMDPQLPLAAVPAYDPSTALDEAAAWVASRNPDEIAPRASVAQVV